MGREGLGSRGSVRAVRSRAPWTCELRAPLSRMYAAQMIRRVREIRPITYGEFRVRTSYPAEMQFINARELNDPDVDAETEGKKVLISQGKMLVTVARSGTFEEELELKAFPIDAQRLVGCEPWGLL